MLFGCRQTYITFYAAVTLLGISSGLKADQMNVKEAGTRFAKEAHTTSVKFADGVDIDGLTPLDQKGKIFDSDKAKRCMKEQNIPANEIDELLNDPNILRYQESSVSNESILAADKLIERYNHGYVEQSNSDGSFTIETCLLPDAPFKIDVSYFRNVDVILHDSKKVCRICKGHERKLLCYIGSREDAIKREMKRLASDPTIKTYTVEKVEGFPLLSIKWTHHDDAVCCNSYRNEERVVKDGSPEVHDVWIAANSQNEKMAQTPNCIFIQSVQQNPGVRIINGVEVSRNAWERIDSYKCRYELTKCPFLGSYRCIQKSKECKEFSDNQCALWEMTFKCLTENSNTRIVSGDTFGTNENLWATTYEPNTSFSEAATKLKIFDEIKNQFENSVHGDITKIKLFSGKKSQCSKSVESNLMYDCCFSFQGFTNEIKLSKCTADEIALAEMRDNGLCHYIGSYDEKFLDLWKSRKEHVYCCFPTKLSRVLQEEGREQLKISWGSPESPNCRGLTQNEIQRLDFSRLDLSEAYSAHPSIDMTEKIDSMQERLKRRLAEYEGA